LSYKQVLPDIFTFPHTRENGDPNTEWANWRPG